MDLDQLKKLSEIFNNIAQPIATVIAALVGTKYLNSKNSKSKRKKK